jgi:RNA polymerase sigma factor (sigma-70 family)
MERDAIPRSLVFLGVTLMLSAAGPRAVPILLPFDASGRPLPHRPGADVTASFEETYRATFRGVYRYILVMTGERDDVEDIVADVFTRAFAAWRSGRGPAGRPLPWLLLIARRLLTDRWRRRRLLQWIPLREGGRRSSLEADATTSDRSQEQREFWLWLDALSAALPARQREVLLLRYERDLSDEDIGEILGLSSSGVRSLAARAVASLRRHPELWS